MELSKFSNSDFDRGATRSKEFAWQIVSSLFVSGSIPGSKWRSIILKAFGARIGRNVIIKPRVLVKFPWRLQIGSYTWIGEGVWIDNLEEVQIGNNVCISQDAYLCTGNHDWSSPHFDLITGAITIEDHSWVGARASVAPGTHMEAGSVLGLGAVGSGRLKGWTIYSVNKTTELVPRRQRQATSGV